MSIFVQIVYLITLSLALTINLYLMRLGIRYRDQFVVRYLLYIFFFSNLVVLAWLGLSLAPTESIAFFWTRLRLIVISMMPAWFMIEILYYANLYRWLALPRVIFVWFIPAVNILFVLLDPLNPYFIREWSLRYYDLITVEVTRFGIWQTISNVYYILMAFVALALYAHRNKRISRRSSLQFAWILAGILVGLVGSNLNVWGLLPRGYPSMYPVGVIFGGLMIVYGLRKYPLLDYSPIAHELVFKNMVEAVIVLNAEQRIVDVNPSAVRLFPANEQVLGQPLNHYPQLASLVPFANHPNELALELEGTKRYFAVSTATVQLNPRINALGRVLTLTDITDRKLVEQEREQLLATLDAYTRTVAHDLKNPLGVISGYLVMAMDSLGDMPEDALPRYYLRQSKRNTETMTSIIDALLLLAVVRRTENLEFTPVDMYMLATRAVDRLVWISEAHQARITIDSPLPPAIGYAHWIEEIWLNYLTNAIKYGGNPPTIHIFSPPEVHFNGMICYGVRDNGSGISPDEQSRLFKEFSRLERHRELEGHGLGLMIVRQMTERMGGHVYVDSTVGEGTTFYFALPRS